LTMKAEGVEPAVVVVVERRDAGPPGLEQEAIGANAPVHGRGRQARACRVFGEGEGQRRIGGLGARGSKDSGRKDEGDETKITGEGAHHLPGSLANVCGASFFAMSKCLRASASAPACFSACASA
jgi:hypothetical protein